MLSFVGLPLANTGAFLLDALPQLARNNGLMHVFEDDPVFAVIFKALFVLIGLRVGLEVDEVARSIPGETEWL